ncbi:MAG: tetratricopeptide (TPR) repeat protein [Candidatus Latescibacterota bacterium]
MNVVVIAQDVQGAEVAKPWVEKAKATYRALLDQHNLIGRAYNLKFVPVGILLDEEGKLARAVGSVNIDNDDFRKELTGWVSTGAIPKAWIDADTQEKPHALTADEQEADARFQLAIVLLENGKKEGAISELQKAFQLDPQNWLIRKQLWAIETPEAFYSGNVDYGWQKAQMAREKEEMERQK